MHRADSFPKAIELAVIGLQTILGAASVELFCKRYHHVTGDIIKSESSDTGACRKRVSGTLVQRSIWPRDNLCLIFCATYEGVPPEFDELLFDMTLEQLLCAGDHLPAEPDVNIDDTLLSRREREVMPLVASGQTNGDIAAALGISERTVEKHVAAILDKTGLSNRKLLIAASQGRRVAGPVRARK
ncbi:MAG: helix-turn-helix transcriptional regulator [Verrucomicrobiales bacterium]|nr:helix-turn-helix transcriptional regulator [Verrucomicrobiales bacterium]